MPCVLLLCLALVGASTPSAAAESGTTAHAPVAALVGRIEGRIVIRERPARRMPNRYPGGAAGAARPVQRIPAVVYLEGRLPGGGARAAAEMAQQDTSFTPGVLVVPVGTEVRFPNRDPFFHNVFSYSTTQRFDLGRYPQGESKSVRFDEPGVVKVYCEVHESMRAAVVVTENPHHVVVGADGTFVLDGVPAGVHRLVVWHVDEGTATAEVRVTDGGRTYVELTLG